MLSIFAKRKTAASATTKKSSEQTEKSEITTDESSNKSVIAKSSHYQDFIDLASTEEIQTIGSNLVKSPPINLQRLNLELKAKTSLPMQADEKPRPQIIATMLPESWREEEKEYIKALLLSNEKDALPEPKLPRKNNEGDIIKEWIISNSLIRHISANENAINSPPEYYPIKNIKPLGGMSTTKLCTTKLQLKDAQLKIESCKNIEKVIGEKKIAKVFMLKV